MKYIKDIARSISVIPDRLLRSEYCKITSSALNMKEEDLLLEISAFLTGNRNNTLNSIRNQSRKVIATDKVPKIKNSLLEECEKELLRLLFNYGDRILEFEEEKIKVNNYILEELGVDNISFSNSFYKEVLKEYSSQIDNGVSLDIKYFLHHQDKEIQQLSISFISKKHEISSKWEEKHQIYTGDETKNLEVTISKSVLSLKQAYIKSEISQINDQLKNDDDPSIELIGKLVKLNKGLVIINKLLSRNFN